jgi:surface protein
LPLVSDGTYDFTVDWGDGTPADTITAWDDPAKQHTYATAGIFDITITGVLVGWRFVDELTSVYQVRDVKNWGSFNPGNNGNAFSQTRYMTTITATDGPDLTGVTTLNRFFYYSMALTTADLTAWDVSGVQDFSEMFYSANYQVADISTWDVSSATSFYRMFSTNINFNVDISGWNVSSCQNFGQMFYNCDAFNQDISGWDVSSGTQFGSMFADCLIFNQDITGWNMSNAVEIFNMFGYAYAFNQNISSWNIPNVLSLNNLLRYATAFNQNLGSWNVTGVTSMSGMLDNCGLSVANYDGALCGWGAQAVQSGVTLTALNVKHSFPTGWNCLVHLRDVHGWTITDGGH